MRRIKPWKAKIRGDQDQLILARTKSHHCLEWLVTWLNDIFVYQDLVHLPFVHAPSRLTMFFCSPMWIKIFNSDTKSLYSASVALSVEKTTKSVLKKGFEENTVTYTVISIASVHVHI